MPKYRLRLESPDLKMDNGDPHYAITGIVADTKAEAVAIIEQRQRQRAAYQLPAADREAYEQAEKDADKAGEKPSGQARAALAAHRQTRPYEVVDVEKVS